MNEYLFTRLIERQPEGDYLVSVPAPPTCYAEGQTLDKARIMAADAIRADCASLLRRGESIPVESANPLDNSPIHTESYPVMYQFLELTSTRPRARDMLGRVQALWDELGLSGLAQLLEVGEPTLADNSDGAARPGRDLPSPFLRQDGSRWKTCKWACACAGRCETWWALAASVGIGVKQDGLVQISKMVDHYVCEPFAVVNVGDVVEVISVDLDLAQIALSMRE